MELLVAKGTPEEIIKVDKSYTGKYLKKDDIIIYN